jgi:hypothetical protein
MKKVLMLLGLLSVSLSSFSQLTVKQTVTPTSGYKVGDTLTVKYVVDRGASPATTPRYFWLRYQYNNKALALVANSTTFGQGTSTQTYFTSWNNYKFTQSANAVDTQLYSQYLLTPWNYLSNADWNVGQLTVQRTDASINGELATQKYVLKDQNAYNSIHKLDLAYSIDAAGANISPIVTAGAPISLTGVVGNTSQFKVRVLFPSNYSITDHNVQLMKLKSDGSGDIDWTQPPVAQAALDASGEALFTTQVKVGDSVGVFVAPAMQKSWLNNIITVSDAYKAFLGVSQVDISGNNTYFTYPVLEKKVGLITKGKTAFSESDAFYSFAYVMGQDVSTSASVPTSTSTSVRWYSGLLNQSWLDGVVKNRVRIIQPNQTVDAVFAWGGDLDWSHSSSPSEIATRVASGNYLNSINPISSGDIRTMAMTTNTTNVYEQKTLENAKLSITSTIEGGKVILTGGLTKEGLAGLQVIMQYDSTKLTLENVIFDAGSTITNFSTHDNGRLTFGSIDQLKTARIKIGTPYKLVFSSKTALQNTAGLFYFVLADAVDAAGNKINLTVE